MSNANPVNNNEQSTSTAPTQPSSAKPSIAGAVAAGNTDSFKSKSLSTTIGSMNELKEQAPDIYNAIMKGLAESIISEMREGQERVKKKMREGYQNQY